MATIHISDVDAARDFAALLAHVRSGAEVIIESGTSPVAVLHAPVPSRRTIEECLSLLPKDSAAIIDEDFAADVKASIAAHREPLNPPAWAE
jgi:antitoxin (DNA-binding transcriptional repressor) of toxin-antitoxin stability system